MTVNLHAHTTRCGHASGTERDYIERAIEGGLAQFGFSDHAPWRFPDGYESGYRVPVAEAQDYVDTLRRLREEYRDRIRIHIGFEMEYYPAYFEQMREFVSNLGAEYLILGCHFMNNERPDGIYAGCITDSLEVLRLYVDTVVGGIQTGAFTYAAHPDIINFCGDEKLYAEEMSRICRASVACNIPLELNFLGLRDGRRYPRHSFWEKVAEFGCPVVFGCDAHDAKSAYDKRTLAVAERMVERYGLHLVEHPTLIHPKTGEKTLL